MSAAADRSRLRHQAVSGVAWSGVGRIVQQSLQLAVTVVLARLLLPKEFGLVGLILVFTGFAGVFIDLGLAAALIQRQSLDERHRSTTFWLSVGSGVAVTLLFIALAPAFAAFYDQPRLVLITVTVSFAFALGSLGVVQSALLTRRLDFRRIAMVEIAATAVAGAVAIAAAATGAGVWSLVLQVLVAAALESLGFSFAVGWRPRLIFDRAAVRDLWHFSSNVAGFNAINYWARNADNLLIGKVLGPAQLGLYGRAYNVMMLPIAQIAGATSRVMFPALSQIQTERPRVRSAYLRAISMIALVTFPLVVGLFVTADNFVRTLFGPKWAGMVPVLRVLCGVALPQSIATTVGWLYQSQGRSDWMFRWSIGAGIVIVSSFAIGISWGIVGVAVAYLIASSILVPLSYLIVGRLVALRFADVLRAVSGVFVVACAMGAAVWGYGIAFDGTIPRAALFTSQIALGALMYVFLVHVLSLRPYRDLRALVQEYRQRPRPDVSEVALDASVGVVPQNVP